MLLELLASGMTIEEILEDYPDPNVTMVIAGLSGRSNSHPRILDPA